MYQALYRQYRPMIFDQVLGQDHIINTLKNQIINENIGHAYLFSGTRGTGKTSTAKILSRAVNCLDPKDSNPCNECEVCKGILDGSIMDVVEMDAASNRGVNDIRDLRDKVVYPPSYGKYKVYIIDEVHMLTQEAFNALLKTLEEPPKHLIFILATTEPERIPQTILSRCQRFDFRRITSKHIMDNMKDICLNLEIDIEDEALRLIARNADGAMRDALSLLDQCLSFSKGKIEYKDALAILGIVNKDVIFKLVDNIIGKDIESILIDIDQLVQEGRDVHQFIKDIIDHFRDLMIVKTSQNPASILEADEEEISSYRQQVEKLELDYILNILNILTKVDEESKFATQPRILLEMGMINIVRGHNISLEERVKRLEEGSRISFKAKEPDEDLGRPIKTEPSPPIKDKPKKETRLDKKVVNVEPSSLEKDLNPDGEDSLSLKDIQDKWASIFEAIRKQKANVSGVLRDGKLIDYENGQLTISFGKEYSFHKNSAENNRDFIEEVVSKALNRRIKLKFELENNKLEVDRQKEDLDEDLVEDIKGFFGEDKVEIIRE